MATTIREELQEEFLSTLRKGQLIARDALKPLVETIQFVTPPMPAIHVPLAGRLPTPHQIVAGGNDFAEHLLASQRKFTEDLLKVAAPLMPGRAESAAATETYKPGQVVPRDGTVECARHHDVQDHVKAGTRFAPCSHHHEHSEGCTWQYV